MVHCSNSTLISNTEPLPHGECLTQRELPSEISDCDSQDTPSEADTDIIPCGRGSPSQHQDESCEISDSQLAEMGDEIETEAEKHLSQLPTLHCLISFLNPCLMGTTYETTILVLSLVTIDL